MKPSPVPEGEGINTEAAGYAASDLHHFFLFVP
jgi:hypothetical protein